VTPAGARTLYDYNRWANRRVLAAAGTLDVAQFVEDRGNSFGSVRDTLAPIFGAEWVWLRRWQGNSPRAYPPAGEFESAAPSRSAGKTSTGSGMRSSQA